MIERMIIQVRRLPGMRRARAIIVVESNLPMCADSVYETLQRPGGVENKYLLYLDPIYTPAMVHHAPADAHGEMNPGLRTTERNKPRMMDFADRFLREGRLLRHANLVTHANIDSYAREATFDRYQQDMLHMCRTIGITPSLSTQALLTGRDAHVIDLHHEQFGPVFEAESRYRLVRLMARQWKNMVRKTIRRQRGGTNGADIEVDLAIKITGKHGGGGSSFDPENKDDIVMATGIGIIGAEAYYIQPQFMAEREALGLSR